MALYADGGGGPTVFELESQPEPFGPGTLVLPVVPPQTLLAGTYWIVVEVDSLTNLCVDTSASNTIDSALVPFGSIPPDWSIAAAPESSTNTVHYNLFVVAHD
jgi:hypothetical protein